MRAECAETRAAMVSLPFAHQALVEERKLTEYLLNPTHPKGHSKAEFFFSLPPIRHKEGVEQWMDTY
jgi:hypothetical protein